MSLIEISRRLARATDKLSFAPPVTHVYNPPLYARIPHETYLDRFGNGAKECVFIGMNPGPWGMAQTGVPFGDVAMVRDWMGIDAQVGKPAREHPNRPIDGFACTRSEVSGTRFWGWARNRFQTPHKFFERFFVWNYCPLSFMLASGANFTPDKLPPSEREPLFQACDQALRKLVEALQPRYVVGVGKFAELRARSSVGEIGFKLASIPHPSPANPAANKNWAAQTETKLRAIGIRF